MKPTIDERAYELGFDAVRAALADGLGEAQPGMGGVNSFLIGGYVAAIAASWANKAAEVTPRAFVQTLAAVLGDVAAQSPQPDGAPPIAEAGVEGLLNAFVGVAAVWAPKDARGHPVIDGHAVLAALAAYAGALIGVHGDEDERLAAYTRFGQAVTRQIFRGAPAAEALRGVVGKGGTA